MDDNDWTTLVRDLRNVDDADVAVAAAERLHRTATSEDVHRLEELLQDESLFIREAAAWPLSEIVGAAALPQLFAAYQRGFDEGHDNDGFSAALADLAEADPEGVRAVLDVLAKADDGALRENARWLLEFCASPDA